MATIWEEPNLETRIYTAWVTCLTMALVLLSSSLVFVEPQLR